MVAQHGGVLRRLAGTPTRHRGEETHGFVYTGLEVAHLRRQLRRGLSIRTRVVLVDLPVQLGQQHEEEDLRVRSCLTAGREEDDDFILQVRGLEGRLGGVIHRFHQRLQQVMTRRRLHRLPSLLNNPAGEVVDIGISGREPWQSLQPWEELEDT